MYYNNVPTSKLEYLKIQKYSTISKTIGSTWLVGTSSRKFPKNVFPGVSQHTRCSRAAQWILQPTAGESAPNSLRCLHNYALCQVSASLGTPRAAQVSQLRDGDVWRLSALLHDRRSDAYSALPWVGHVASYIPDTENTWLEQSEKKPKESL